MDTFDGAVVINGQQVVRTFYAHHDEQDETMAFVYYANGTFLGKVKKSVIAFMRDTAKTLFDSRGKRMTADELAKVK